MSVEQFVAKTMSPLLAVHGFKKRAGLIFTLPIHSDVNGWLGLNRATKHYEAGEVELNPVVGVRFEAVERIVNECRNGAPSQYLTATVGGPIGLLMPEHRYRAWVLNPDNAKSEAPEIVDAILTFGIPFMKSISSLRELRHALDEHRSSDQVLLFRRPVAAFLDGDRVKACELIDAEIDALGARTDPAAEELRKFATVFRKRVLPSP